MVSKYWDLMLSRSVGACPVTGRGNRATGSFENSGAQYGIQRDCPGMATSVFRFM